MIRYILIIVCLLFLSKISAQNLFKADTFVYTINLDLSQNVYLKSIPKDLLQGYCKGNWKAYYPKREMNECLYDDFLKRFNSYQINTSDNTCIIDYCNSEYFNLLFNEFQRKLKFKEVVYFDQQHSVMKREILWLKLFYSRLENEVWKHYEGPIFWMFEINQAPEKIKVVNKMYRTEAWSLEKTFSSPEFIVNENTQKNNKQKLNKILKAEEY